VFAIWIIFDSRYGEQCVKLKASLLVALYCVAINVSENHRQLTSQRVKVMSVGS